MIFHRKNPIKLRRCPECGIKYLPVRKVQPTCGHRDCETSFALKLVDKARHKREKMERAETRKRLIELKPLQYWLKRTEKAVNAFVRERDSNQPCISCGTNDAAEWHAGHWKSVGANSALRFDYSNIHKQCNQCNVFKGGNATEYELRLPARIGLDEFVRLKYSHRDKKWTREECQAIEDEAKKKLKAMKSKKEKLLDAYEEIEAFDRDHRD